MSAVISSCGKYRYRLDRDVQDKGIVVAYFGINPSTADATIDDHTVCKWRGFTLRNGGRKFIVGNIFAYRCTDVKLLPEGRDAFGLNNDIYLKNIINEADILIPCWGNKHKVNKNLREYFDRLLNQLLNSDKPVYVFGFTKSGDPKHPLMLSYDTRFIRVRKYDS